MKSESEIPIEQRYLWFEGKASSSSLELVQTGLPPSRNADTEILFAGFAYMDLPLTRPFDIVFPKGSPQAGIRCPCKIIAATQQFGKPLDLIPDGWKTICIVHFMEGIPELIKQLPVVDDWYQNQAWVGVCHESTWLHLIR
ncbi:MAG: hypothetical protein L6R28_11290 [Planctomycetes bacterium]|nr:hypothetical protein [Planctomycetota bacterium]